jgi:hypothetical protein
MCTVTARKEDLFLAKRGVAALTACAVQALTESDPTFQDRFLAKLEKAYRKFDRMEGDMIQELELLAWTREYITGWSPITGQDKPFLED